MTRLMNEPLKAPAIFGPQQYRGLLFGAAILHRCGMELCQSYRGRMTGQDRQTLEAATEDGWRFRDLSFLELAKEMLVSRGLNISDSPGELIRMALMLEDMGVALNTAVQSILLSAFVNVGDSTAGWTRESDVSNFKPVGRVSAVVDDLDNIPSGTEASKAHLLGWAESYRVFRFGKLIEIAEEDLIDDRMDLITRIPEMMGIACARLKPAMVYSIINSNPDMFDNVALFHGDHGNLATGGGSALGKAALSNSVKAMGSQTFDDVPLNLKARYLLAPPALKVDAMELLKTLDSSNPEERIELRSDSRLGAAGCINPVSGERQAGSDTAWYMAAPAEGGAAAVEVGYLAGTDRKPMIVQDKPRPGFFGLSWSVKFDIGAKAIDYRTLYRAAGV